MSLGSSHMAGSALGTASSLLLLASIIQGFQDVEVIHNEKMEALVGEDVTLPCTVKNSSLKTAGESMGSLLLPRVSKWDRGVYICDLTIFPHGSIRRETRLEIKEITCDVDSTVEVHTGGNVSIHCTVLPNTQYSWTKNKTAVSASGSLELWRVTEAHAGVYTLTVNTGNKSVHKEFIITVLTETTGLSTDPVTLSPQSTVTETGLVQTTDSQLTTTQTSGLSTIHTTVTTSDITDNPTPSNVTTSFTDGTQISVTPTPDPHHLNNSTYQAINTSTLSDQSVSANLSSTLSHGSTVFRSTQETTNESRGGVTESTGYPDLTPSGTKTMVAKDEDIDGARSHLVLVLIIVLSLVLIVVAGFLYRRHILKQRMDLPPPFKPPPPPVKYTSARKGETYSQRYPTSRCNSVAEP
uniref:uncharacterized protein isoform X2 n=1 Tax=Semicossyphus pulcher TaxID=241346 RepID=UPI0037E7AA02